MFCRTTCIRGTPASGRDHGAGTAALLADHGPIAEWEAWTRLRFPESGEYVFPAGLATLDVDTERDVGEYWEPNVWLVHNVSVQAG